MNAKRLSQAAVALRDCRFAERLLQCLSTRPPTDPTRQRIEALLDTARQRRAQAIERTS